MIADIPSPTDLCLMNDAVGWESTAMLKRPWRIEFFAEFAKVIQEASVPVSRVLELGPGFLVEHLLTALPNISYVA